MRETIKARLLELGIQPSKAFGQNFLINTHVIQRIIDETKRRQPSDLIEIGPGIGALTDALRLAELRPRLIELDAALIAFWRGRDLEVIDGDALKIDWQKLELRPGSVLVSNLPYQISTHLVIERCFGPENLRHMILMFQKEVAQRLMAAPRSKEYGLLSVMAQLHFEMRKLVDAAPQDFYPAPKVASRVLTFERRPDPGLGHPFLTFLKGAFAFRRKFLLKNLRAVVDKSKQERLLPALVEMGFTDKARAEELSPAQLAQLFRKTYEPN